MTTKEHGTNFPLQDRIYEIGKFIVIPYPLTIIKGHQLTPNLLVVG